MLDVTLVQLITAALATWRICYLLMHEDGPLDISMHIRTMFMKSVWAAQFINCIYCVSVWVGGCVAVLTLTPAWIVLLPFAFSAVAIVVNRHVYVLGNRK